MIFAPLVQLAQQVLRRTYLLTSLLNVLERVKDEPGFEHFTCHQQGLRNIFRLLCFLWI